jgi:hypothetical protein
MMLGMSLMVAVIGVSALYASRSAVRAASMAADADEARVIAHSALEIAQEWIAQDPNWRTNRPHGVWASNQPIGQGGTFSIEVTDPADGDLADHSHESVTLTATATKGPARRKLQVTLAAQPTPLEALRHPIHVGGQLQIRPGAQLFIGNSPISTNGALANNGVLFGSAECQTADPAGIATGSIKTGAPAKPFPAPNVPDRYAAIATLIDPGNSLDRTVLGPGANPFGVANPSGVYVVRPSGDLTVKDARIYGTLVVILSPGRKLRVEGSVNIEPSQKDMPALIVKGDAELSFTSAGTPLSEGSVRVNFNPNGAPYAGVTDGDRSDLYPSQIKGLIHVTGRVLLQNDGVIRGAILCESTASTDALATDTREIFYDPDIYKNPPRHYTASVPMVPMRGSYRRVVD